MTEEADVRDALASISNDYAVRGELHAVPPHAVYEVTVDGTRAVCKVGREPQADPATEARVMEYVGRETSVPVPRILAVGDDWFVAEWCDGLPDDDPTMDAERARTLGAGLATLHEETAGEFERTGFPRAADGELGVHAHDSWAETACALLADRRDYLAKFGYAEVAEAARSFVCDHPDAFGHPSDRAGTPALDPVLAHGNYLPDHIAVGDGEPTCVVDWEHALVAPAEYDYWRTAIPLFDGPGDPGETEREAFREGYESVRPLPGGFEDRADAYRLVDAVSYLKSLHVQRRRTGQAKARFAKFARGYVYDAIEELREEGER